MLRITTKIDCDSCGRTIEVEPEAHWAFDQVTGETSGNVVLVDVDHWLAFAGWDVDTDQDKQICPDCIK